MIYHTYFPSPPLSQFVAFLWSSEGEDLPQAQVRLLPIGMMELVINLCSNSIPAKLREPKLKQLASSGWVRSLCFVGRPLWTYLDGCNAHRRCFRRGNMPAFRCCVRQIVILSDV
ncbi:MAG: DUF6597 domain-containing transcriptional factor [Nostocaceae cyanobacterium]|nr:DUF6597 domain-containing transcriptional factor [Nostocaceae cyanobacterium]